MKPNDLSPAAISAALRGGTEAWGEWGSAADHVRYCEPVDTKTRRLCRCGCRRRATHRGMANGMALIGGCELSMRRWVRDGFKPPRTGPARSAADEVPVAKIGERG